MLTPLYTSQFKRDTERMKKRGKNLEKIKLIIRSIAACEPLDDIHRDHKLIGNWRGRRECHVESDWLLIYIVESDRVVFERSETNSDLFQK
ncbi:MAG: damage-inducible protein [delta proteobacterium ML8_D]|jgi:mRNA interferase YafQ|nr:MAG: damage-inducible protein [delta proteobacterium ML8_D]